IWYVKRSANGVWNSPIMIDDPWDDSEIPDIAVNSFGKVIVAFKTKISGAFQLVTASPEMTAVSDWILYEEQTP
ncbi:MAG: hypothetical protein ACP5I1_15530, partial [Candidatus Hinthialibacter sp.]